MGLKHGTRVSDPSFKWKLPPISLVGNVRFWTLDSKHTGLLRIYIGRQCCVCYVHPLSFAWTCHGVTSVFINGASTILRKWCNSSHDKERDEVIKRRETRGTRVEIDPRFKMYWNIPTAILEVVRHEKRTERISTSSWDAGMWKLNDFWDAELFWLSECNQLQTKLSFASTVDASLFLMNND